MKQAISAIFIAVLGTLTLVQAQQTRPVGKCSLTLAQAPKIRDVRLGMSSDEVLKLFPGSSDEPYIRALLSTGDQRFGIAGFSIPPTFLPRQRFAELLIFPWCSSTTVSQNTSSHTPI